MSYNCNLRSIHLYISCLETAGIFGSKLKLKKIAHLFTYLSKKKTPDARA